MFLPSIFACICPLPETTQRLSAKSVIFLLLGFASLVHFWRSVYGSQASKKCSVLICDGQMARSIQLSSRLSHIGTSTGKRRGPFPLQSSENQLVTIDVSISLLRTHGGRRRSQARFIHHPFTRQFGTSCACSTPRDNYR